MSRLSEPGHEASGGRVRVSCAGAVHGKTHSESANGSSAPVWVDAVKTFDSSASWEDGPPAGLSGILMRTGKPSGRESRGGASLGRSATGVNRNPKKSPAAKQKAAPAPSMGRVIMGRFERSGSAGLDASISSSSGRESSTAKQLRSASHWGQLSDRALPNSNPHMGHVVSAVTYRLMSL